MNNILVDSQRSQYVVINRNFSAFISHNSLYIIDKIPTKSNKRGQRIENRDKFKIIKESKNKRGKNQFCEKN